MKYGFIAFSASAALCMAAGSSRASDPGALDDVETAESALSAQPTPENVFIESIAANGTGCDKPGSVTWVLSDDRQSFVIIFTQMTLNHDPLVPSSSGTLQRLNCAAVLQLHVPQGIQVSVGTINTRGFARLARGQTALQSSDYFFAGVPVGAGFRTPLTGPFEGLYTFTDQVSIGSVVWSDCGASRPFTINASLFLDTRANAQAPALFNTDTIDGAFKKVLHIQTRPCPR